jgi:hypothetical protein
LVIYLSLLMVKYLALSELARTPAFKMSGAKLLLQFWNDIAEGVQKRHIL